MMCVGVTSGWGEKGGLGRHKAARIQAQPRPSGDVEIRMLGGEMHGICLMIDKETRDTVIDTEARRQGDKASQF